MGNISFDEEALKKELNIPSSLFAKSVEVLATVTRGDGTVEDLGTIAFWHSDPEINLAWQEAHPDTPSPGTDS
jgi:hypothetical protein